MSVRRPFVICGSIALIALVVGLAWISRPPSSAINRLVAPITPATSFHQNVAGQSANASGLNADSRSQQIAIDVVPDRQSLAGQPALVAPKFSELSTSARPPLADLLGAMTTLPGQEPRIVLNVLDAYRQSLGSYPTGENNRQIVNALLGANGQKIPFIPSDHPRLNAEGEIVDAWQTPFFFHLISHDMIEVRSAGPDRAMYTADDIVAGPLRPKTVHPIAPDHAPGTQ